MLWEQHEWLEKYVKNMDKESNSKDKEGKSK
jgi:hypothetical protein